MNQQKLDKLLLLALFLTVAGDLLAFFLEVESQRQAREEEQEKQVMKKEISELRSQLAGLKIKIESFGSGGVK